MATGNNLFDLPQGWTWVLLPELGELNRGKSKHRPRNDPKLFGGKYPFIQTGDVRNSNGSIKNFSQTYNEFGLTQSRLWDKDTLCITIAANIAETSILNFPACFPDSIVGFVADSAVCEVKYVHFFIKSVKDRIEAFAPATAQKNINLETLRDVWVPLPPRNEQIRIVEKIEELFTQLDAGVELLKKLKKKLKRYRQAVLKAAVQGKLTQEWRETHRDTLEPASVLRDRILKERREKWEADQLAQMQTKGKLPKDDSWKKKYKEPASPNTAGLPELPGDWCWLRLEALCTVVADVDHKMPKAQEAGIPYVSPKDFRGENEIDFERAKKIDKDDFDKLCRKVFPEKGSILLSRYGTIGEIRLIKTDRLFQASYSIAIIKPLSYQLSVYLDLALRSKVIQSQIQNYVRGVTQLDLGLAHIKELAIPLPPLAEQVQILNEVEKQISLIDQLVVSVDRNLKRASTLRQSILKQAFEGKLVPQDPDDEPASVLCDRIKAEKAKREAEVKAKRKNTVKSRKSNASSPQLEIFQGLAEEPES